MSNVGPYRSVPREFRGVSGTSAAIALTSQLCRKAIITNLGEADLLLGVMADEAGDGFGITMLPSGSYTLEARSGDRFELSDFGTRMAAGGSGAVAWHVLAWT